jgi:PKHD-type hydroxylase
MYLQIPRILTAEQLGICQQSLAAADWIDGRATAGHRSVRVKRNSQLPQSHPAAVQLGATVVRQLESNAQFMSAALPLRIAPPLFNRYGPEEEYGRHIDGAVRAIAENGPRLRTDLSATLFLSDPATYDGGELLVEDPSGATLEFKLAAGDLLLYPSSTVHRVAAVRSGSRLACFFWIQSLVREGGRREMLYALDAAIQRLTADYPEHPSIIDLTAHYHNLVREWADV